MSDVDTFNFYMLRGCSDMSQTWRLCLYRNSILYKLARRPKNMVKSIPEGFEDTGTKESGHTIIRCKKKLIIDGNEVQCTFTTRNTKQPKPHTCRAERFAAPEKVDIMKEVAYFLGSANLSLSKVKEDFFTTFLKQLISYGQIHSTDPIDDLLPTMYPEKIRAEMIDLSKKKFDELIIQAREEPSVCLSLDAGTLSHRHLLDFVIISPSFKPIFYKAVEKTNITTEGYRNIVSEVLNELLNIHKVKVVAIVTDNLPVQITALAHWSPTSVLNTSNDHLIRKILFYPCLCHTTQLIVEDTEKEDSVFAGINGTMREMVTFLRSEKIKFFFESYMPFIRRNKMAVTNLLCRFHFKAQE